MNKYKHYIDYTYQSVLKSKNSFDLEDFNNY